MALVLLGAFRAEVEAATATDDECRSAVGSAAAPVTKIRKQLDVAERSKADVFYARLISRKVEAVVGHEAWERCGCSQPLQGLTVDGRLDLCGISPDSATGRHSSSVAVAVSTSARDAASFGAFFTLTVNSVGYLTGPTSRRPVGDEFVPDLGFELGPFLRGHAGLVNEEDGW